MVYYAQIDLNGNVLQTASGFDIPPFDSGVKVSLDVWDHGLYPISQYPEAWVYHSDDFQIIEGYVKPTPPSEKPTVDLEQRITEVEMSLADIFAGNI